VTKARKVSRAFKVHRVYKENLEIMAPPVTMALKVSLELKAIRVNKDHRELRAILEQ
jgi:hypothetical protein